MSRQARLDPTGFLQHVIARGVEKIRIFCDKLDDRFFIKRLRKLLDESHLVCFAWGWIPNHSHLLFCTGATPLATLMRRRMTPYATGMIIAAITVQAIFFNIDIIPFV